MRDKKRRSNDVSMDVAAALQQAAKSKDKDVKKDFNILNIKIYLEDFERFKKLKVYVSQHNHIYSFQIADVFNHALPILKKKYKFKEISDDEVLNTAGGRRPGAQPIRMLSLEEQRKIAKKNTTVKLSPETLKLYNAYKTYMVKKDIEIGTADLFRELLETVENQYKI
jgi:hypothetical protein